MAQLGRLAAGVAHDFNNVLAVVGMRLDRLEARRLDGPSHHDVAQAQAALARAGRLVANLMSLARPGAAVDSHVDLNDHVASMERLLDDLLGDRVEVGLHLDATRAVVALHEARVSQIVVNLAVNARESMPRGGRIRITTSDETVISQLQGRGHGPPLPPGRYVRVDVADTGEGIEPALASRIFEPFFTTKHLELGSGLGLATVHEIVTQAGGFITLRSAVGQGSTFSFWLPTDTEQRPDPLPDDAVDHQIEANRKDHPLVLLVEDDVDLRTLLAEELRALGYRVTEAGDGLRALEFADPSTSVLVTDVRIPGLAGPDLARRLMREHPGLAVVFMTGHVPDRVTELLPPDAVLLIKPFTVNRLDVAIRSELTNA